MTESTAVQAALDQFGSAVDELPMRLRLALARQTLAAMPAAEPQARPIFASLHMLTEDASPEQLGHLASVLDVVGPDVRAAVRAIAGQAAAADDSLRQVWDALAALCDAVTAAADG